ncbi:MAG: DUF2279 domain-containing protein [Chitinophagaceae bacterium]|nr:MAG: DUF2279 domain-containing protein [Chitinophagaceae bacterium]
MHFQPTRFRAEPMPVSTPAPDRMRWFYLFLLLLMLGTNRLYAQDHTNKVIDTSGRRWLVGASTASLYGGTLLVLQQTWYSKEDRSSFHTFNDSREWLQVDKFGHAWTAFNAGKVNAAMWQWAGFPRRKAVVIGGLSSLAFLTGVEVLDGFSSKWGWSWSDIGANVLGTGLLVGQELAWGEQRIQYKFSFHRNSYSDPVLNARANDLYGAGAMERMLKDYNAQTYWFSLNIKSFFPDSPLPAWLNLAAGYGAAGMYGGFENKWTDPETAISYDRSDLARSRQFYISPDIDFTKIPTKSRFLKTAFSVLNSFKCPAPALMLSSRGKLKGYFLYF